MNWFKRLFNQPSGTPPSPERMVKPEAIERSHTPTPVFRPDDSPSNFTPRAQQVLSLARKEADRFHHNFVGTEHLLLGLIALGQGVGFSVLLRMGLDLQSLRGEVEKQVGTGPDQKLIGNIPYTPRVRKVLALAAKEARTLNHTYVGTEHLLLGLLREGDGVAARVLKNFNVDIEQTRFEILKELDPNFEPTTAPAAESSAAKPQPLVELNRELVDVAKRYDVYCVEQNLQAVVYRNVSFKSIRSLFHEKSRGKHTDFCELEHADGQTVFVAMNSIVKFCEPGTTPRAEILP